MNLFAYGTLMCGDILAEVAGRAFSATPAVLEGYRRLRVRGEDYPAMVPGRGDRVHGVLYRNLPPAAWPRLDRFEGEMYLRRLVRLRRADGCPARAYAYVLRHTFTGRLEPREWDYTDFLRRGKPRFQAHYGGYAAVPRGR